MICAPENGHHEVRCFDLVEDVWSQYRTGSERTLFTTYHLLGAPCPCDHGRIPALPASWIPRASRSAARSTLEQLLRPASEFFEVREQPSGVVARGLPRAVPHFVLEAQDASIATFLALG